MREMKVLRLNARFWKTRGMAVHIYQEREMTREVIFGVIHFSVVFVEVEEMLGSVGGKSCGQVLQCTTQIYFAAQEHEGK